MRKVIIALHLQYGKIWYRISGALRFLPPPGTVADRDDAAGDVGSGDGAVAGGVWDSNHRAYHWHTSGSTTTPSLTITVTCCSSRILRLQEIKDKRVNK